MLDLTNRPSAEERAKLPKPGNFELAVLFAGIDKVLIKDGGVNKGIAMGNDVLLTSTDITVVRELARLLTIDEANSGFYCMCLGDYAIELYSQDILRATLGFHHGVSFRYEGWDSDAALASPMDLLEFLADKGLAAPLNDRKETLRRSAAARERQERWFSAAPVSFGLHRKNGDTNFSEMIVSLDCEIPDRQEQIAALLAAFGRTILFWSGFPSYESIPGELLNRFSLPVIIDAYMASDRNLLIQRGMGRYLCQWRREKLDTRLVPQELVAEIRACFETIGEREGVRRLKDFS